MRAVTLNIEQDIKAVSGTVDLVLNAVQMQHSVNEQTLFELKVILNELIVNSLCHGNQCSVNKKAYVSFKLVSDILFISVKDEGQGFNHDLEMDTLNKYIQNTNKEFCEHGRGLVIVKMLCDKVKFNRCGNRVIVMKNLN